MYIIWLCVYSQHLSNNTPIPIAKFRVGQTHQTAELAERWIESQDAAYYANCFSFAAMMRVSQYGGEFMYVFQKELIT